MKNNVNYKLYLVTDRNILKNNDFSKAVEQAILGGVTLVQLREKDISTREFYNIALNIKKITDKYDIPLIINDRLDIALSIDAAGLHVGQKDMPADIARKLIGKDKILGVSVCSVDEARKAEKDGADYIGVGAVFPTSTKKDADAVSIERLKEIKESVSIPVVAIGGINENNAVLLKAAKIDGIAVVSCILGKDNIKQAAKIMSERADNIIY
ncbi:thiamine-phosphate diphosphorylase [Caloramator quimbayensis]|uniref:Thiamine-phosphate synthase n=1 Tax=Caloramator quimbayensis TaxID=1147123 RepID=A0A1T4WM61_9CLOT|nr:thiamine phosphate synthase [Caloramator quimbayensis]SKA78422.1 thiamine-phosphate diphosphorylase [Caloramator quimbayensis]